MPNEFATPNSSPESGIVDPEPPTANFEGCFNSFLSLTQSQVEDIVKYWLEDQ